MGRPRASWSNVSKVVVVPVDVYVCKDHKQNRESSYAVRASNLEGPQKDFYLLVFSLSLFFHGHHRTRDW